MARKTGYDTSKLMALAQQLMNGVSLSKSDRSYLNSAYSNDDNFRQWFDQYRGGNLQVSSGRVRDAKDMYGTYGFTPLQNSRRAGAGTNAMLLRSGKRTNQTGEWQDAKIYEKGGRVAGAQVGNGRMRTAQETKSIIQRGLAGASLSDEDQRIFDRWQTIQRETAENRENAEQHARQQEAIAQERERARREKAQTAGIEYDPNLTDAQLDEAVTLRQLRNKNAETLRFEKAKADMEAEDVRQGRVRELGLAEDAQLTDDEYARIKENRSYGLPDDYMMNANEREGLKKGTKRTAYSEEAQRKMDALDAQLEEKIQSGKYTPDMVEQMRRVVDNAKKQWYHKQVEDTPVEEMNGAQAWEKTRSRTLDDGSIIAQDAEGKWYTVWKPEKGVSAEDKRAQVLDDRRDKFIQDTANKLMTEKVKDESMKEVPKYADYEQALEEARKRAVSMYGASKAGGGSVVEQPIEPTDAGWDYGTDYDADVAHGYTGSYDDWLAEFGGGTADETAIAEPAPVTGGHVKKSYL